MGRHFRITFITFNFFFSAKMHILVKPCFAFKKFTNLLSNTLIMYLYFIFVPTNCIFPLHCVFFLHFSRYSTFKASLFLKHTQTHTNTSFFVSLSIYLFFFSPPPHLYPPN